MSKLGLLQAAGIVVVLCLTTALASPAQTYTVLVSFNQTDGSMPAAGLVQATDGNFYGTTEWGGAYNGCQTDQLGCGTVFKMTPVGALTTLYSFCAQNNCTDGYWPLAALVQGTDGSFYGTTPNGGANSSDCNGWGCGTVFKITPAGTLTTLYSFCSQSNCTDGGEPSAALVQATDGNFYGTTFDGGANNNSNCSGGCGTVFKITAGGALTTLYSFCSQNNCTDGAGPGAGLIQATDGNFYGTTAAGGANNNSNCSDGCGTVFKITAGGALTTLHSFCAQNNCTDGYFPNAGLVQATDGNFYGTTSDGGANNNSDYCGGSGCGTVFKITAGGTLTTLYSFCSQSNCTDGFWPVTALVQGTDGNIYGTTSYGGAGGADYGTAFKITPQGALTTLHSFCSQNNCTDGTGPNGLIQATDGSFYGTAAAGGAYNWGTVFKLSMGLGPFVETRPTSGKVGTKVIILGNNLKGTTLVAFHGTKAQFKVVSKTEIKTSVPSGATTGLVTVTTPTKKLKSNVKFRVTQ